MFFLLNDLNRLIIALSHYSINRLKPAMQTRSKKTSLGRAAVPELSHLKYRKQLKQFKTRRDQIILISNTKTSKYQVYLDEEIGMSFFFGNQLISSDMDQDFDSSDEIVESGINKCQSILEQSIKSTQKGAYGQVKNMTSQNQDDSDVHKTNSEQQTIQTKKDKQISCDRDGNNQKSQLSTQTSSNKLF